MSLRRPTVVIVLVATIALAAYDVWPMLTEPDGDTISEVLRDWAVRVPFVPAAFGVLCGHWFFPSDRPRPSWGPPALAVYGVALLVASLVAYLTGDWMRAPMGLTFLAHIPLGARLWTLERPEGMR